MKKKIVIAGDIPVRSIMMNVQGEEGIEPFNFICQIAGPPVSFSDTYLIHQKNEPNPVKFPDPDDKHVIHVEYKDDPDVDTANRLKNNLYELWNGLWIHTEEEKKTGSTCKEAAAVILELMQLFEKYGMYCVPYYAKVLDSEAIACNPRSNHSFNFSPAILTPVYTGEEKVSEEEIAELFAKSLCGLSGRTVWQAKFVMDGNAAYTDILKGAAGMFSAYNKIVTEEFEKKKGKKKYQMRNVFDPEKF